MTGLAADTVPRALRWVSTRGVELRGWSDQSGSATVEPSDHPVLYLVAADAVAPHCGSLQDWVREPIEVTELYARADRLMAWAQDRQATYTRVDDDAILRVGDGMVALSELEARLMRALVDSLGVLILRDDIAARVWPDGLPSDPRAIDNRIKSVRARIEGLPLRIHTIRGRGFLLERTAD